MHDQRILYVAGPVRAEWCWFARGAGASWPHLLKVNWHVRRFDGLLCTASEQDHGQSAAGSHFAGATFCAVSRSTHASISVTNNISAEVFFECWADHVIAVRVSTWISDKSIHNMSATLKAIPGKHTDILTPADSRLNQPVLGNSDLPLYTITRRRPNCVTGVESSLASSTTGTA